MSGHNRWTKIKHKKGAEDARKGKVWSKVIKEITIAARDGGGDPAGNPRLRRVLDLAKSVNLNADNIDRAIKRGTGQLEGVSYEELTYEGVGPAGALFMIEVVTDNRNRTAAELRKIFDLKNGQLGGAGSAGWGFDHRGIVRVDKDKATEDALVDLAAGAGAEDVALQGDAWVITTPRESLDAVRDAVQNAGIPVLEAVLAHVAKNPKVIDQEAEVLMSLALALDDHDDVQRVFTDFEPSEAALARMDA